MIQQFIRFLAIAALLGSVSIIVLELIEWFFQIRAPAVHGMLVSIIYLVGVFVNFHLQRGWVFKTTQDASLTIYASWMIFCSLLTGIVSGFILGRLQLHFAQIPLQPSISLILALSIISPITFIGVSIIMKKNMLVSLLKRPRGL